MPSDAPLILGFDTSAAHCAVALLCGTDVLAEAFAPMTKGQAEQLFPMIQGVMAAAGHDLQDLGTIAVGTGPGNFTGIRIAVAAARGLGLSLGCRVVGVTGFQALEGTAPEGSRLLCLPAVRGALYLQWVDAQGHRAAPVQWEPGTPLPGDADRGLVLGASAAQVARALGPHWQAAEGLPPQPAVAVAQAAQQGRATASPPVPTYVRAADAAPASDPPPLILP